MKIALIAAGVLIGLVLLCAIVSLVIGSRLPLNHTASRSMRFARSPADVYAVIRNVGQAPAWRSDVREVELIGDDKFREFSSRGAVTYQIIEDVPDRKLVARIVDFDLGYGGSWEYNLEPSGDGTLLTITERGEISNVLFRFMARYLFGHTASINAYLNALSSRLR
jgi:Polyketide cyclase / dehydrase and lipid transport